MTLPESVLLCDALELVALTRGGMLSVTDLARIFFPGQGIEEAEQRDASPSARLRDALHVGRSRHFACGNAYPFEVTERSIQTTHPTGFDPYLFLLLGRTINFGGPEHRDVLLRTFRSQFEDLVCWAMRRAGFVAEVISEPREPRGLPKELAPALRELAGRLGESATLLEDRLEANDNDLDVDILAVPIIGNGQKGGWPAFHIQCATGAIGGLQQKVGEGRQTFSGVWDNGFFSGNSIRGAATPHDLLFLSPNHWNRLSCEGWILDRTRIVFIASHANQVPLPQGVSDLWEALWAARNDIDFRSWQAV